MTYLPPKISRKKVPTIVVKKIDYLDKIKELISLLTSKKWVSLVLMAIAVASIIMAGYFYHQYSVLKSDSKQATHSELTSLLVLVGKLIVLPDNETPSLATVTDPQKLQGQAFFAGAKAGDKVLIYAVAHKAILYRPSENKIVEVAPLNMGAPSTMPTP